MPNNRTPNVSDAQFTGWDPKAENHSALMASAEPGVRWMTGDTDQLPIEVDPRPWHVIEFQMSMGSCQGHANTSVVEGIQQAIHGKHTPLCRMFAYIGTQKIDGISGDKGSTIKGGGDFARDVGHCAESLWPYTGRYTRNIPDECYKNTIAKISKYVSLKSSDQLHRFIGSGQGFGLLGIMWGRDIDQQVGAGQVVTRYDGNGRGGHAIAILGYYFDSSLNEIVFIIANSWDERWGERGYFRVSASCMNQMLKHRWTVLLGFTDQTRPKPRVINWSSQMRI